MQDCYTHGCCCYCVYKLLRLGVLTYCFCKSPESGKVCVMGWIPGTDLSGLKEDLLHGKPVTDVACSWNGLMLLTQAGECFVWKNFTTTGSTVAQIVPSDQRTKFSSVSCGDSHYILVTGM